MRAPRARSPQPPIPVERDPNLFADFARTKRQLLSLLGLRSPATMHWLFAAVFPELEVAIRRTILQRPVRSRPVTGTVEERP